MQSTNDCAHTDEANEVNSRRTERGFNPHKPILVSFCCPRFPNLESNVFFSISCCCCVFLFFFLKCLPKPKLSCVVWERLTARLTVLHIADLLP